MVCGGIVYGSGRLLSHCELDWNGEEQAALDDDW